MPVETARKLLLATMTLLCATQLARALPAQEEAPRRANVLFLFADDQRTDTIAAHGNPHIETPCLDRLVAAGYSFRRTYCMGAFGGAVCVPSRAMMLSGRHLFGLDTALRGVPTLPEILRSQGYATFVTGKWHNGEESLVRSFERGDSVFLGGMSNHLRVPLKDLVAGRLENGRMGADHSSELFADAAIEFLSTRAADRPFFCYVAFTAPHDPRQPPDALRGMYSDRLPPLPANFLPQHPFDNGDLVTRDERLAAWPRTEAIVRQQLAEYYALISHLDGQVGRILAALEANGLADDTVVVYAADQGIALGSHGLLGKQNVYEHSMGCPLIFRGPAIPAGGSSDAFAYLFDIFPTLCELLAIDPPEGLAGASLAPVWRGERAGVRDSLFLAYRDLQRAVRDSRYKLIRYPKIDHTQLFDLAADPFEVVDLAGDPAQAGRIETMTELLEQWQARLGDEAPLSVDEPRPLAVDLSGRPREPDRHQPDWVVRKYFTDNN